MYKNCITQWGRRVDLCFVYIWEYLHIENCAQCYRHDDHRAGWKPSEISRRMYFYEWRVGTRMSDSTDFFLTWVETSRSFLFRLLYFSLSLLPIYIYIYIESRNRSWQGTPIRKYRNLQTSFCRYVIHVSGNRSCVRQQVMLSGYPSTWPSNIKDNF